MHCLSFTDSQVYPPNVSCVLLRCMFSAVCRHTDSMRIFCSRMYVHVLVLQCYLYSAALALSTNFRVRLSICMPQSYTSLSPSAIYCVCFSTTSCYKIVFYGFVSNSFRSTLDMCLCASMFAKKTTITGFPFLQATSLYSGRTPYETKHAHAKDPHISVKTTCKKTLLFSFFTLAISSV